MPQAGHYHQEFIQINKKSADIFVSALFIFKLVVDASQTAPKLTVRARQMGCSFPGRKTQLPSGWSAGNVEPTLLHKK